MSVFQWIKIKSQSKYKNNSELIIIIIMYEKATMMHES